MPRAGARPFGVRSVWQMEQSGAVIVSYGACAYSEGRKWILGSVVVLF